MKLANSVDFATKKYYLLLMAEQLHGALSENFYKLTPDHVMHAVENVGFHPTGEYFQLNSYENRVFDIFLDKELTSAEFNNHLIAKFYRPHRWTQEAILEEHNFLFELQENGISAIAPIRQKNNSSVSEFKNIFVGIFPKALGRLPQELFDDDLVKIGRSLARIHNIGEQKKAQHRPMFNTETRGWPSLEALEPFVSSELWSRYEKAASEIFDFLESHLDQSSFIRIHGDCHRGNLLYTDRAGEDIEFFFIDFDDFCNGPPVQDFWMLFSSDESGNQHEQDLIFSGYEELRKLDRSQLVCMSALRGLHIVHYGAWIARRWIDPTFPHLFPQFKEYIYWAEETEVLEKIAWSL